MHDGSRHGGGRHGSFMLNGLKRLLASLLVFTAIPAPVRADGIDTVAIEKSVVRVIALVAGTDSASLGTGWLISGRRIIATNNHVVEEGTGGYKIGFLVDGRVQIVDARLLRRTPEKDLAILEAAEDLPGEALVVATGDVAVASRVIAVGFPGTADSTVAVDKETGEQTRVGFAADEPDFYRPTWTEGVVSRQLTRFPGQDVRVVQHSAPINHGNSGGPLFDPCGRVVGVNTFGAILDSPQGIFYSIHPSELLAFVEPASFRPATVATVCTIAAAPVAHDPMLQMMFGATVLLSAAALVMAYRRKSEVVMKPLSAVVDRVSRIVDRDASAGLLAKQRRERLRPPPDHKGDALVLEPADGSAAIVVDITRLKSGAAIVIGRSRTCDVILEDPSVSRRHARISLEGDDDLMLEDLGSSFGTERNGEKIRRTKLRSGDRISLGSTAFKLVSTGLS